jgi:long-chain acyl-CoA synthetase/crotonobetaine/carnitine-CoA ligase
VSEGRNTAAFAAKVAVVKAESRTLEARYLTTTIGEFVSRRARDFSDQLLFDVFDRSETATYAQADRRSNRIAHALAALGVAKGDRVAVMLPNRIDYPLVWFALAKLGAVHVPVNTRYTPREIAFVCNDAGVSLAIVDAAFAATFLSMDHRPDGLPNRRVLVVDGPAPKGTIAFESLVFAAPDVPVPDRGVAPGDLMNIQYTSGTTGFPKGCMLTHDYWMLTGQTAFFWDATPAEKLLTAQPYFYMDPQWQTIKTLVAGGTLYIAPQLSTSRYIRWLKATGADWCQFPLLMTRQPETPDDGATRLRQTATFGWDGETCRAFTRRFGAIAREGFGMTEIGLATWMPVALDEMADSASVGLDAPFRETTIRDETGQPVRPGERGELWVRGRSIFKGYWNRPDANEDSFRPAEDSGPLWFRTGDLFEADAHGFLWLVGRLKDMIRRSSENIAAREVEAVVRELPKVEDCAAVPVPDVKRGEEVKIYVQLKAGLTRKALPPETILAHCRARLAAFKVPRFYAYVDAFPRTVSNKIEKRNLVAGVSDLRAGSYDSESGNWIGEVG